MNNNLADWLLSEEENMPPQPAQVDPAQGPMQGPNITQNQPEPPKKPETPDVASDPQTPDMPTDVGQDDKHFEQWKREFMAESIKGDVESLKSLIYQVRDRDLDNYPSKFVEDNLQILFVRENSNINTASKELRNLLKSEVDHNNPGCTVVNHMSNVLAGQPALTPIFIKLSGMRSIKGELHRQFIAALMGAVQVGSGGYTEDLVFNEKDYSIRLSTRFSSRFGEINLGEWSLKQDDPERYLKPPELKRLDEGSPEEKDVLRRRVVMESIAEQFKTRAFLFNVVGTDGTVYTVGWDLATSLRSAYAEGKLVVRTKQDDSSEAMIDEDGNIIPLVDLKIMYSQQTGELDKDGKPDTREVEFIHRKYGQLMLTAQLPTLREAATSFQGMVFKETPWAGNPSDLRTLRRCIVSTSEQLLRIC